MSFVDEILTRCVCKRMLNKNPEDRPSVKEILAIPEISQRLDVIFSRFTHYEESSGEETDTTPLASMDSSFAAEISPSSGCQDSSSVEEKDMTPRLVKRCFLDLLKLRCLLIVAFNYYRQRMIFRKMQKADHKGNELAQAAKDNLIERRRRSSEMRSMEVSHLKVGSLYL